MTIRSFKGLLSKFRDSFKFQEGFKQVSREFHGRFKKILFQEGSRLLRGCLFVKSYCCLAIIAGARAE